MSEEKHTPEPWSYRPQKHDDWGFIRSDNGSLVAVSTDSDISYYQMDEFRSAKKDPYEPNGKRIVECVNALAGIENPAEWVRILKEERVESHVSYWKEKAENSDWRYKELQSENERLKAELAKLKGE